MKKLVIALSIVDMARADFRVTPTGEVYFIEINALPSLQPGAGIFEASKNLGLSYDDTILHIVASALARKTRSPVRWGNQRCYASNSIKPPFSRPPIPLNARMTALGRPFLRVQFGPFLSPAKKPTFFGLASDFN